MPGQSRTRTHNSASKRSIISSSRRASQGPGIRRLTSSSAREESSHTDRARSRPTTEEKPTPAPSPTRGRSGRIPIRWATIKIEIGRTWTHDNDGRRQAWDQRSSHPGPPLEAPHMTSETLPHLTHTASRPTTALPSASHTTLPRACTSQAPSRHVPTQQRDVRRSRKRQKPPTH